jgi:hypothetical protein
MARFSGGKKIIEHKMCVFIFSAAFVCGCRVKPEAAITVFELLMISGVSLETC